MKKPTLAEAVALVQQYGSLNNAYPHSGVGRTTFQNLYKEARARGLAPKRIHDISKEAVKAAPVAGRLKARSSPKIGEVPKRGRKTYILTCAQNNTHIHPVLWANLKALEAHDKARLIVARTVYNRFAEAASMDKKLVIERGGQGARDYWWADEVQSHLLDERAELAPGLVWCGELNIMPTAADPLTGLDSYTGRPSTVVPHPRIAMRSVASHPADATKFMYTTGTVTQRNYIQRKAGMLAEFHHCYGALLVEVDKDGDWFVRQLNADSDGTIYDLDRKVENGKVTTGHRLEAITWGDIHVAYGDPVSYKLAWGLGGILDTLKPRKQFLHDLIDFRARNTHNIKRGLSHQAFLEYVKGHVSVESEMRDTASFLARTFRAGCHTIVVDSNHDNFMVEWLYRTGDFRKDPANAVYFLEAALHFWKSTEERKAFPSMTRWAMQREGIVENDLVTFLDEGQSYILCPDAHGGIEGGLHGHEGINGARTSPKGYAKSGRKANIGHHHSSGIWDGLYVGGIMGSMDQGYNTGLGSWSQSNIFTYENGKRAISTIYNGKYRV